MTTKTASSSSDAVNLNQSQVDSVPFQFEEIRKQLSVPLICDALDALGYGSQSPRLPIGPVTVSPGLLFGIAKTMLWADMAHVDPEPYKLELAAIDSCEPNNVIVCAAGGSMRSGIWGELLSIVAQHRGCAGAIVDGAVRDVGKMTELGFSVYARGKCPYDSKNRQRVIDFDVTVELDGVQVHPGDLIAADVDGIVVIPKAIAKSVIEAAWDKVHAENKVRDAVSAGVSGTEAFQRYGVL